MKRFFSYLVVAAMIFSVALTVTSCKKDEEKTFMVTFNSNGGSAVEVKTVKKGDKVAEPLSPTLDRHSFDGWYTDNNLFNNKWNFASNTVTEDINLYAKWSLITFAVTFDSDGGSAVAAQNVAQGNTATKPADPTRNGYEFDGWFNGNAEWNFTTAIAAPITLKAKWTAVYIVTFDSDGGSAISAQTIRNGNTATKPAPDPTRNGYEFDGWFNGEMEWNFATAISAPVTLKAKWIALYTVTFDSDGGSAISAQIIRNGSMVIKPADPTKAWTAMAGLYLGAPPSNGNYTFGGWYNGVIEWNFATDVISENITLKAKWTDPALNFTRIETVPTNDVSAAFTYTNANSTGVEEYALLLDANVIIGEQSLNSANVKLTIIGIGAERFITANSSNGRLLSIDGSNASLTLGRNITLKGKNSGVSTHLILLQRGNLTMADGSKITGHNYTGVSSIRVIFVDGINAVFKMEGGEITGNNVRGTYSVVGVSSEGIFEMSGGSITGNNNNPDVFIDDANCTFRLSGNAQIGILMLYANNNTTRSTITIVGNYSGTVTTLNLIGNGLTSSAFATLWTNAPVIINGTAGFISMFNNGGLGYFGYNNTWSSIRATHELNAAGVLVLK